MPTTPFRIVAMAATLTLASAAHAQAPTDMPGRVLAPQNRERARLGLPPLAWDDALARDAQAWADHLAATSTFEHADQDGPDPEGENLWTGTRSAFGYEQMVEAWLDERRNLVDGVVPDDSATGSFGDVGHYTQIVWRATTRVGCATARSREDDFLVCRYRQAGNVEGQRPY